MGQLFWHPLTSRLFVRMHPRGRGRNIIQGPRKSTMPSMAFLGIIPCGSGGPSLIREIKTTYTYVRITLKASNRAGMGKEGNGDSLGRSTPRSTS